MVLNLYRFILLTPFLYCLFKVANSVNCPRVLLVEQNQAQIQNNSQSTTSRIFNGSPSSPKTALYHAWITQLTSDGKVRNTCSGTRIARDWVLTAAHCHVEINNWYVTLTNNVLYKVEEVYSHPNYIRSIIVNSYDVSVLRISSARSSDDPPELTSYPLLNSNSSLPLPLSFIRATGYGHTESRRRASPNLQEVDLPVLPSMRCRIRIDETKQICAGYPQGGCDVCDGDSGGPLMQPGKGGRSVIVAVVIARHEDCGLPGSVSISARVAHLLNWLRDIGVPFETGVPLQYVWVDHPYQQTVNPQQPQNNSSRPTPTPVARSERNSQPRVQLHYSPEGAVKNDDNDDV